MRNRFSSRKLALLTVFLGSNDNHVAVVMLFWLLVEYWCYIARNNFRSLSVPRVWFLLDFATKKDWRDVVIYFFLLFIVFGWFLFLISISVDRVSPVLLDRFQAQLINARRISLNNRTRIVCNANVILACLGAREAFIYADYAQHFFHLSRTFTGEHPRINEGQGHVIFVSMLVSL